MCVKSICSKFHLLNFYVPNVWPKSFKKKKNPKIGVILKRQKRTVLTRKCFPPSPPPPLANPEWAPAGALRF